MKKILCTFPIIFLLVSCASIEKYNQQIASLHTIEDLQEDVDVAYRKLQKLHPRLYTYTPKEVLDAKFDSLKLTIDKPMDSRSFYKKLAPTIAYVRQGHAGVVPPSIKYVKKELKKRKKEKFGFYDLDFEYLDNALWVENAVGGDSTLVGSEVLKIQDEPVESLLDTYKTWFSSDGYNTTFYDKKVGFSFSRFYYYDKGSSDSLAVTFRKNDSVFVKMFRRIAKDSLKKKVKKDSVKPEIREKISKSEKKIAKKQWKQKLKDNKKYGYVKSKKHYTRNLEFFGKDKNVAYMKIRGFKNGNFKDFYKEVFTKIDSVKAKAIVIDLRNNGGGRLDEIHELYSYLTDDEFKFVKEGETNTAFPTLKSFMSSGTSSVGSSVAKGLMAPGLFIWDFLKIHRKDGKKYYRYKSSKLKKPKALNFKGAIYILINGYSFSASSVLSANLQARKGAVLVGEETGGAYNSTVAGQTKFVKLPNSKVLMYFGLMVIEPTVKTALKGRGVQPDKEIIPTQKDRLNNIDPELDWVLKQIGSN